MVFVFGSVSIICYGLAPGLVVPIATQQGIGGGSCGGVLGWGTEKGIANYYFFKTICAGIRSYYIMA